MSYVPRATRLDKAFHRVIGAINVGDAERAYRRARELYQEAHADPLQDIFTAQLSRIERRYARLNQTAEDHQRIPIEPVDADLDLDEIGRFRDIDSSRDLYSVLYGSKPPSRRYA